jgi:hypothetical protein
MERRFGHDFSQVRVHTDARASESAKAIGARAYTVGRDVVFAAGQFAPHSTKGNMLLAHELAHVLQQRNRAPIIQRAPERDEDDDDEPVVKEPRPLGKPLAAEELCGGRPCFTDEDIDRRLPPTQAELNEEAARLGEKQGRRRKFWDQWGDIEDSPIADTIITSDFFRKAIVDLDLVFTRKVRPVFGARPRRQELVRDPSVDLQEQPVMRNAEAKNIYDHAYFAVMNAPEEESRFRKSVHWVCEHTSPCKEIIEQQRANVAGGMSPADAQARSVVRLGWFVVELLAPGQPDDLPTFTTPAPVPVPVARVAPPTPRFAPTPRLPVSALPPSTGIEPAQQPPTQMAAKQSPAAPSAKPAAKTEPIQNPPTKQERREIIAARAKLAEKARQQAQAAVGQSRAKGSPPMPTPAPSAGPPPQTAQDVISGGTAPLRPGHSGLGQYGIDRYGSYSNRPGDRFAGHEILQNLWLEAHGYGQRGVGPASRNNPAVALTHAEHTAVTRAQRAMGLLERNNVAQMSATDIIKANAEAMRRAGIPEDVIQVLSREALNYAATLKSPTGRSGVGR